MSEELQSNQTAKEGEILSEDQIPEEIKKNMPQGAVVRRVKKKKESETVKNIRYNAANRRELAKLQSEKLEERQSIISKEEIEAAQPKTVAQKASNFWYHKKLWIGVAAFVLVLFGMGAKQWFFPTKYDVDIVAATEFPIERKDMETPFTYFTPDYDGNEKQTVQVQCWQMLRSGKYESSNNYENILNQFRLAIAMGDYDPQLYILDEANYQYMTEEVDIIFRDLSDLDPTGTIKGDRVKLSDLAIAAEFPEYQALMEELYICIYDLEQMSVDIDGKIETKFLQSEKFMQHYDESLDYLKHLIAGEKIELAVEE